MTMPIKVCEICHGAGHFRPELYGPMRLCAWCSGTGLSQHVNGGDEMLTDRERQILTAARTEAENRMRFGWGQ